MPRRKRIDNPNIVEFKTEGACRSWVKKNIIQKGGKVGPDYLYHMKDGDRYKCYMFGVERIPKGQEPITGNVTPKPEKKERKNARKPKRVKLNKNGLPRKTRSDKGKKRTKK